MRLSKTYIFSAFFGIWIAFLSLSGCAAPDAEKLPVSLYQYHQILSDTSLKIGQIFSSKWINGFLRAAYPDTLPVNIEISEYDYPKMDSILAEGLSLVYVFDSSSPNIIEREGKTYLISHNLPFGGKVYEAQSIFIHTKAAFFRAGKDTAQQYAFLEAFPNQILLKYIGNSQWQILKILDDYAPENGKGQFQYAGKGLFTNKAISYSECSFGDDRPDAYARVWADTFLALNIRPRLPATSIQYLDEELQWLKDRKFPSPNLDKIRSFCYTSQFGLDFRPHLDTVIETHLINYGLELYTETADFIFENIHIQKQARPLTTTPNPEQSEDENAPPILFSIYADTIRLVWVWKPQQVEYVLSKYECRQGCLPTEKHFFEHFGKNYKPNLGEPAPPPPPPLYTLSDFCKFFVPEFIPSNPHLPTTLNPNQQHLLTFCKKIRPEMLKLAKEHQKQAKLQASEAFED